VFSSSLLRRVYSGYVGIILILTLVVGILVSRQVTENGRVEIENSLAVRSELLAQIALQERDQFSNIWQPQYQNLPRFREIINRLGQETDSRLTVIDATGRVIADSQEDPLRMNNHLDRPEIIAAGELGDAMSSRFSETLQQQMMYRAQSVITNGEKAGFVRVSLSLVYIDHKLKQLQVIVLMSALLAAAAALVLGFVLAKRISDPLRNMIDVAEAISQGDYDRRIQVEQKDEIGKLAEAFNRMARSSVKRMAEITTDRNRLAKIFDGMVEGVIYVDEQRRITDINQAAASLLEISAVDCVGKPVAEQVRVPQIIDALAQSIEQRDVVKTQMHRISGPSRLTVDIYAAALQGDDQSSFGAVVVLHDVSELERLARIRRDFIANASHELKTPITAIRGLTETMLDDDEMALDTRQRFIERVHTQSLRLSSLVGDLMTISRLESDQEETHFARFDLTEVVKRSVKTALASCEEKQLHLATDICTEKNVIGGDMQTISQLVDNLIDNAIKYTPTGGNINVQLTREAKHIRLQVKDTGIGINPKYHDRVFERFYRVDKARSRELGGTGLGLSIVKNIAEQHGCTVSLQSKPGEGSTFTVLFPVSAV